MSNNEIDQHVRGDQMFPENIYNEIGMEKIQKTRQEIYSESHFQWIKTERQGDVSKFRCFLLENDIEYVVFQDDTRVRADLIGDVVLMHQYPEEILPLESENPIYQSDDILNHVKTEYRPFTENIVTEKSYVSQIDPVKEIFEKSKKKTEKITLTIPLKILPPDLYHVIKDNFENVDDVLLQAAMNQIHDSLLRDCLRKELQTIYQKRRKNQ
jgi:hypothetical protein